MRRCLIIFLSLACLVAGAVVTRADTKAPDLTPESLRAFADDFVAATMAKHHVPGAACVIVKDGRLIYSRGYGYANVEKQIPVDPAQTRFAGGSLTKLLTATAVMQLVERGELSLDADVAPLLAPSVRIQNPYAPANPVTLRQCLTHTGGFDQRYLGIGVRDPALVPRLEALLRADPPACVMRPGKHISYSDVGFMLAGDLIERRSGGRYERYVEEHVLGPLGMSHSGFATGSGGRELMAGMSVGYEWDEDQGRLRVMPPLFVKTVPCGGLLATPQDLAAFMIAHLTDGSGILKPQTLHQMHERQFGYDPDWDGMAIGFYDRRLGGGEKRHRFLSHGGVGPGMTSNVFLLPDERVGCFFAFNVYDYSILELPPEAFARQFFPDVPSEAISTSGDAGATQGVVGPYRHVSYPRRTIEKVQYLTDQVSVEPGPDGTLLVSGVSVSEPGAQTFAPVGRGRFRPTSGEGRTEIGFRRDASGRVTHLLVGSEEYERLAWAQSPALHRRLFKLSAMAFAWAGLCWPVLRLGCGWWVRRHRFHALIARRKRSARADRMLAAACLVNLMFLFGFAFQLTNTTDDAMVCGPTPQMRLILWLPPLAALLTLLGSARALRLLTDAGASPFTRLHRTAIAAIAIGFLPLLVYWNLFGFNY